MSFPAVKSHYSREKSKRRRYLSPVLSVAEIHRLYVEQYEGGHNKPLVSYPYYARVFNEEFNLSFGYPKSYTCSTCEQFKIEIDSLPEGCSEKHAVRQKHEDHL